jgi:hypothetical protein
MQTSASTAASATSETSESVEDFLEGTYISIRDGESRTLEFSLDKTSVIEKLDFNGNPVKKVQFLVKDPSRGPDQQDKKFQLSRKHAYKI